MLNSAIAFLQSALGSALLYLLVAVLVDLLLGLAVAFRHGGFTLRKVGDFTVTTLGYQKLIAFGGALALMFISHEPVTMAAVTALATLYATAILPDIRDKAFALGSSSPPAAQPAP